MTEFLTKITQKSSKNDPFLVIFWVIFLQKNAHPKFSGHFDRKVIAKKREQKCPKNSVFDQKTAKKQVFFEAKFRAYSRKNAKKTPKKTGIFTKNHGFSGSTFGIREATFWSFLAKLRPPTSRT